MIQDIQALLDEYMQWLKSKTTTRQLDDWVEITTPHLDRHNDALQIYARAEKNGYLLSDGGYIISDLEMSGCSLDTDKRKQLLKMTLNGFGIRLVENRLETTATRENFALRKHSLVQAMLAVNDMFYLATPMVASLFIEDVASWFDANDIRYTPNVKFTGKSGYDYVFDFVIPKSRLQPERIIRALNRPNRETTEALVFAWMDTREVRSPESELYAILNDSDKTPSDGSVEALRNYFIFPVLWSQREQVVETLAA
jgi:hypothetical protein